MDEARRLIRRPGRALAALLLLAPAARGAESSVSVGGRALGTSWTLRWIPGPGSPDAAELARAATEVLEAVEDTFSPWRPGSEIERFQRAPAGIWHPVSPDLALVAGEALALAALTGGAFDPTIAQLLGPWGHGPEARTDRPPGEEELSRLRTAVDWRRLEARADPPALRRTAAGTRVDLSSPAKGHAADALSHLAARLGASNHLAAVGGDLRAAGPGPAGAGWPVGVEEPGPGRGGLARIVRLRDEALSTSGNGRNRARVGGLTSGHLLDPRTGRPADGPLASVSVRAPEGRRASGLATGLFVLGPEQGPALARRHGLTALFLVRPPGGEARDHATGTGWEPAAPPDQNP